MLTVTILLIEQPPVTGPFSLAGAASLLDSSMVTVKIYDNGTYIGNSPLKNFFFFHFKTRLFLINNCPPPFWVYNLGKGMPGKFLLSLS